MFSYTEKNIKKNCLGNHNRKVPWLDSWLYGSYNYIIVAITFSIVSTSLILTILCNNNNLRSGMTRIHFSQRLLTLQQMNQTEDFFFH